MPLQPGELPGRGPRLRPPAGAVPAQRQGGRRNLKKGLAYLEQNQIGQAIVQFRFVRSTYPGSDEAKIARDKLTSLGAQP